VLAVVCFAARSTAGADRFWINSAGGNFTSTANWSATPGGAGGASVPTASDWTGYGGTPQSYTVNFPRDLQFPVPVYAMREARVSDGVVRFADSGILGSTGIVRISGTTLDANNRALVVGSVGPSGATLSTTLAQFEGEVFALGSEGNGTLRVEGGSFSAIGNADMFVGGNRGGDINVTIEHPNATLRLGALNAFGNVSILGAGSQLTVAGELQFGAKGATVFVSGGGHLSTGSATMEQGSTFLPNAVSISDGSVWTNAGDLTVRDKVNVFNGSVLVGGQMNIQSPGRLFGVGEIQGDVLNLGETWPDVVGSGDEALHIDGNYSQADGANAGILHIQMPLSSLFGRLKVSGDVTLGGTLRIITNSPQYGDEFDILDWDGTLTGMFISVDDDLPPKFEWDLSDFAASGVIRIGSRFSADFNVDGFVDQLDLSILKFGFGAVSNAMQLNGDADGDQEVDGADFLLWQQQFGMWAGAAVGGQIPEPSALCVALMSVGVAVCWHFKFRYAL
jgi:hypothetical protein